MKTDYSSSFRILFLLLPFLLLINACEKKIITQETAIKIANIELKKKTGIDGSKLVISAHYEKKPDATTPFEIREKTGYKGLWIISFSPSLGKGAGITWIGGGTVIYIDAQSGDILGLYGTK